MSGFSFSPTKANVFLIVFDQVSGTGSVKMGFIAGANVVFCHRFDQYDLGVNAIRTTSLPVRFEVDNSSGSSSTAELRALSCGISSSGSVPAGVRRSCGLRASAKDLSSFATSTPVMSLRLKSSYARATARLAGVHLTATTVVYYEIVLNGTLAGSTWTDTAVNSITEYDTSSTSIEGGEIVHSGYCASDQVLDITMDKASVPPLASNISGVCDIYTLNVICLMSSGITWVTIDVDEVS
jgi:hypothetical protein